MDKCVNANVPCCVIEKQWKTGESYLLYQRTGNKDMGVENNAHGSILHKKFR